MTALNLAGQKFGRLTAISVEGSNKHKTRIWLCVCECGRQASVLGPNLVSGCTRSCGCLQREIARRAGDRTRTHGMNRTSTHAIWSSMRQRCENPKRKDYPIYGGRGITVCERWRSFENFLADMGPRPPGLTLDRIDGNKGYEPANCRWVTVKEQNRNTSATRHIDAFGERLSLAAWAERTGIIYETLEARLRRGWSPERALTAPVDKRFSRA